MIGCIKVPNEEEDKSSGVSACKVDNICFCLFLSNRKDETTESHAYVACAVGDSRRLKNARQRQVFLRPSSFCLMLVGMSN